jgi:D-alanine-D-alanine ligase
MAIEVDPEWWKFLFDEVYLVTDARSVGDGKVTRREVDLFCGLLPLRPADRILDLCGGQGRHSLELSGRGFGGCTVLDYSRILIEHGRIIAADQGRDIDFIQGDAGDTGLPDESFDHVLILGNSLGYLPGAEADLRIMKEARRLLRPGGWFLVDVTDGAAIRETFNPNAWHEIEGDIVVCRQREIERDLIRAREVVLSKEQGLVRDQTYAIRIYEPEALAEHVREAGFADVELHQGLSSRDNGEDCGFMNHRFIVTARKGAS